MVFISKCQASLLNLSVESSNREILRRKVIIIPRLAVPLNFDDKSSGLRVNLKMANYQP